MSTKSEGLLLGEGPRTPHRDDGCKHHASPGTWATTPGSYRWGFAREKKSWTHAESLLVAFLPFIANLNFFHQILFLNINFGGGFGLPSWRKCQKMGDSCPRCVVCADLTSDTDFNNLSDFEPVLSPLWTQFPRL